jgi:hypothetical protein
MNETTPGAVVQGFLDAVAERDFDRARAFLADTRFSYRSPLSDFDDATVFIADISRVGSILERIEVRRTFVDGDEVCTIINFFSRMDRLQVTPVVQWARVAHGRIAAMEVFFDARQYASMFEVD